MSGDWFEVVSIGRDGQAKKLDDAEPPIQRDDKTLCPRCGGSNGAHGLIHSRHENGGGSNKPCPNGVNIEAGDSDD